MADNTEEAVVVTLTDFVTVPPTLSPTTPPVKSTFQTSVISTSEKVTSKAPTTTSSVASSTPATSTLPASSVSTSTPSIPPAPPAALPNTVENTKIAGVVIGTLILITLIYLITLGLCLYSCFRGKCPHCEETAAELRRLRAEKGIPAIRKWDVAARERVLRAQKLDEEEEVKEEMKRDAALSALEGRTPQLGPQHVVAPEPSGDPRQWGDCVSLQPPRPGEQQHWTPPPPSFNSWDTRVTRPDEAHLPPDRLHRLGSSDTAVGPGPYEGQPLPDRVPGEVYRNNRNEVISHFEPYM